MVTTQTKIKLNGGGPFRLILILSAISFALTLWLYPSLPGEIAIHWNIHGEIDNYGSKNWVFLFAAIPLLIYILALFLPRIDPRRENYVKHRATFRLIITGIALAMIALHWITILFSLQFNVDVTMWVKIVLGLTWVLIGNYIPRIRHNYTFGIRTPWTLANENVWIKTHRIGGYGFIFSGIIWLIFAPFSYPWVFSLLIGEISAVALSLVVVSWLFFRKENHRLQ